MASRLQISEGRAGIINEIGLKNNQGINQTIMVHFQSKVYNAKMDDRLEGGQQVKLWGKKRWPLRYLLVAVCVTFLCVLAVLLPPIYARFGWRLAVLRAEVQYALRPPEKIVFLPVEKIDFAAIVQATKEAIEGDGGQPASLPDSGWVLESLPTIPDAVKLAGVHYQAQRFNNCGPATVSMALSYWGWEGDQDEAAAVLRPMAADKNVMPHEITAYVEQRTEYKAMWRVGGNLLLVKSLLANGYPVMLEKGSDHAGWVGHYVLATGFDDAAEILLVQDSLSGADLSVSYTQLYEEWRAFNFTFLLIYLPEDEVRLKKVMGAWSDSKWAAGYALAIANEDTDSMADRQLFFAWFNKGSSHTLRGEFLEAALAYDFAFRLYEGLQEGARPWRMMWYQSGPYEAYFNSGRYQDVIHLAETTLDMLPDRSLEEAYYWRGKARLALGNAAGARQDFERSLQLNPNFQLGSDALATMEVGL